jgi:hypothetical protein
MENGNANPMSQLPQLLEALLMRLEGTLAEHAQDPARRELTEALLGRLRKQVRAMQTVTSAAGGEGLTPEQAAVVAKVPVPQVSIFPSWATKESKESK